MKKRLQNRIAESRYALPTWVVIFLAACMAGGLFAEKTLPSVVMIVATTFVMVRMNTTYAIMRTYSRMPACTFLTFCGISLPLLLQPSAAASALCLTVALFIIFSTYQDKTSTGLTFLAFIIIGLMSLLHPITLLLVPILWIVIATRMMAMSARTFAASLLGLLLPYWLALAYMFYMDEHEEFLGRMIATLSFTPLFQIENSSLEEICMLSLVLVPALVATVHYIQTTHEDKIKTRMIYETLIIINISLLIAIILQPWLLPTMLPLMIVVSSPLVARYITYTHSRLSNLLVIIFFILSATALAYNLWTY